MRSGSLIACTLAALACNRQGLAPASDAGRIDAGGGGQPDAADGGPPDAAGGRVTFHLDVPGTAFCDQLTCGTVIEHVRLRTSGGESLMLPSNLCTSSCSSASVCSTRCLAISCPVGGGAVLTTRDELWEGQYEVPSACGASCLVPATAPPGSYVAQLCATPGAVTAPDGGLPVCTATGAEVCGPMVAFTFPSATPVELTLPPVDGG